MRMSTPASVVEHRPVTGGFCFRAPSGGARYCTGWIDLATPGGRHVACSGEARPATGKQCAACRNNEGFTQVHQAHRGGQVPRNVRGYLSQPHLLYFAGFGDGTVKVGTVAEARLHARLAEQGALAAYYVAEAADGIAVRKAEAAVSHQCGLPQLVTAKRKLLAALGPLDRTGIEEATLAAARDAESYLAHLAETEGWVKPLVPAQPWRLPAFARAFVEAAPHTAYPLDLTTGDHSLYVHGMLGSLAAFSVRPRPDGERYVADLSSLRGLRIALGDYTSEVGAVQPSLF
nr:DUF2797 domain-containing protein [Streptomyces albus]